MYQMVAKGIREGITFITHKYAKANSPFVPGYDASKPSNYQMYFDANNLCGWAISQSLPECGFAWVDEPESVDYINVSEDAETGYILEVDLEYPAEIHDQHNDYPMAPENRTVQINDLSEYSQNLRKDLGLNGKPNEKLVPNSTRRKSMLF